MLFRSSELRRTEEPAESEQPQGLAVGGTARSTVGHKKSRLHELVGELKPNEHLHIPSMGTWSMHDMLAFILQQTGPADVWIATWTITEKPVRTLLELMESGAIRQLKALLSERVEAMNPAAHQLARFNLQVKLAKTHAKSIVVLNDAWGITVGGSANFTRNPRIEKYIISTHRSVAEAERNWLDAVIEGERPFDTP
jgi:hypothetical protein